VSTHKTSLPSWTLLNNAFSDDEDYMHTENRFKSVIGFFRRESPLCRESSPDLLERAISFPLAKILHKAVDNQSPLVPFFLFFDLFPFFRQMVIHCHRLYFYPCLTEFLYPIGSIRQRVDISRETSQRWTRWVIPPRGICSQCTRMDIKWSKNFLSTSEPLRSPLSSCTDYSSYIYQ